MTTKPQYPDTREGALQVLKDNAVQELVAKVEQGLADGSLVLGMDPEVDFVWGVCDAAERNFRKARVIVYCRQGDFEVDEEWLYTD